MHNHDTCLLLRLLINSSTFMLYVKDGGDLTINTGAEQQKEGLVSFWAKK